MGNIVRGPLHILVNQLDQTIFGAYTATVGTPQGRILVHKPSGTKIPADNVQDITVGYGEPENLETMVLDLFGPYPCRVCDYVAELTLTSVGRKQGTKVNHREVSHTYQGIIPSLEVPTGTEISDANKLSILRQIITSVNHHNKRVANAGMMWVVTNPETETDYTVTVRLQNGVEVTFELDEIDDLADEINSNPNLNPFIRAYGTGVDPTANQIKYIIESIQPCYFELEVATVDALIVNGFFLKLEQVETHVKMTYGGGVTNTMWKRVDYTRFELDSSDLAADTTADAAITVSIGEQDYDIANVETDLADKIAVIAEALSSFNEVANVPASNHTAALVDSGIVTVVSLGTPITAIANTVALTDLWIIEQINLNHVWSLLDDVAMAQIFPNSYGNEHQFKDLPIPGERYFKINIIFSKSGYGHTLPDEATIKINEVHFYIRESLLPLVADGTTGTLYWEEGINMMADNLADITQDIDFIGLFNLVMEGNSAGEDPISTDSLTA